MANPILMCWLLLMNSNCSLYVRFSLLILIYNLYKNLHKPRSWVENEAGFSSLFILSFKGPSGLASRSSLGSGPSCETNRLFDQIC